MSNELHSFAVAHPAAVLLLIWSMVALARGPSRSLTLPLWFPSVAATSLAGIFVGIVAWYVTVAQYSDHAEPGVAAVSWILGRGESPYPPPGSANQFGFPYGPVLYAANAAAMQLLGPSLLSSKLVGGLAATLSVVLGAIASRRVGGSGAYTIASLALGYLTFASASFWTRPEPLLLLMVAAGLLGVAGPRWLAIVLPGLALGLGMATKVSAVAYMVPALVMIWIRWEWKVVLGIVVVAAAAFLLPFASAPYALDDYRYWVSTATTHGIRWRSLPGVVEWAAVLALPSAVALWSSRFDEPRFIRAGRWALTGCLFATLILAAKRGTGPHHFLAFVPTLVFLEARMLKGSRSQASSHGLVAVALTALVVAVLQQTYWIGAVARAAEPEAVLELQNLTRTAAGPLAVGYGSNYKLSYLRPIPVFAGQPYQLDAVALMDAQVSGAPMPDAVLGSVRACRMRAWLIPAGVRPFELASAYDPHVQVFGDAFVDVFRDNYVLTRKGRYFDTWTCARVH